MKKTVLTFGLISGILCSLMMSATVPFADRIGFDRSMLVGYTTLVLSFTLVFFGIRSYRLNCGHGTIGFGRAFAVGISITLITSVFYVATWEIVYFFFMPDFMDKYAAWVIEKARVSGATAAILQEKLRQIQETRELYNNPLYNAAVTFIEPLPVGLAITLVSAAILRRKTSSHAEQAPSTVAS